MLARCFVNGAYPIARLGDGMDQLFDNLLEGFPRITEGTRFSASLPAVNIWEDNENLYVEAEVPGLALDDIELLVTGDELTINGTRKDVREEQGLTYHRQERQKGRFSRVVPLPVDVDVERAEATLREGVLRLTLPKVAQARLRKIEVKA